MAQLAYYNYRSSTSKVVDFVENLLLLLPKKVAGVELGLAAGHSCRPLDEHTLTRVKRLDICAGFQMVKQNNWKRKKCRCNYLQY